MRTVNALGTHLLLEFHGCDPGILDDPAGVKRALTDAVVASGATVLESSFHKFTPQGVSGVVVIAESHAAIHTWPEHRFAAMDIFTCGTGVDPWAAHEIISAALHSTRSSAREIRRGLGYADTPRRAAKKTA